MLAPNHASVHCPNTTNPSPGTYHRQCYNFAKTKLMLLANLDGFVFLVVVVVVLFDGVIMSGVYATMQTMVFWPGISFNYCTPLEKGVAQFFKSYFAPCWNFNSVVIKLPTLSKGVMWHFKQIWLNSQHGHAILTIKTQQSRTPPNHTFCEWVCRRHLHCMWNINMAAWLYHGNESL